MHVVFVVPEMAPFSGQSSLAAKVGALTAAMVREGVDVTAVVPGSAAREAGRIALSNRLRPLEVELAGTTHEVTLAEGRLASGVEVKLLGGKILDDLPLGSDPASTLGWTLLSKAAVHLLEETDQVVDVVHTHDWYTASVSFFFSKLDEKPAHLASTRFVLTVHDLLAHGVVDPAIAEQFGADGAGKSSILEAGITASDRVVTESVQHAREILATDEGAGADLNIEALDPPLVGICDGIDTDRFDPQTDPDIEATFGPADLRGKADCKRALQLRHGLVARPEKVLLSMVADLDRRHGVDLLLAMAPRLLRSDVQLLVAGDGDEDLVSGLTSLADKYPDKVAFDRADPESSAPVVFSGSDVALMPHRIDPRGRKLLIAMRYGAIPVVRRTGVLADRIVDADPRLSTGNGFVFATADGPDFLGAALRAVAARMAEPAFAKLVRRVMETDVSWARAARLHTNLYTQLGD